MIVERFPELTVPSIRARWFWKAKVRLALTQARLVLTVSSYSACELAAIFGLPAARVRIAEGAGFGLPAVEAAVCGSPVIATTRSPLPELLEGAGFFIEPGEDEALVDALRRLARDAAARQTFSRAAVERAGRLDWERSAEEELKALTEAGR